METPGINPELDDMIARGQLSAQKQEVLAYLKELVDSYATTQFVSEEQMEQLKARYHAEPAVVTWGDYFQTEIASRYFDHSDEDFARIIETIRFDIVSSIDIFTGKSEEFFVETEKNAMVAWGQPQDEWTEKESEAVHLQILMKYFREMGLDGVEVFQEDRTWFEQFLRDESMQAG